MSGQNQTDDNQDLQAPPRLVEALRRFDKRVILVAPQMDEAALSGPRLHLARVKQRRGGKRHTPAATEDLALAARTAETNQTRPPQFPAPEHVPYQGASHWWKAALGAAILVGIGACLWVLASWVRAR